VAEISNAKGLFQEFMSKHKLEFELGGPEVPLSQADQILRHLNTRFRITVSQKASVSMKSKHGKIYTMVFQRHQDLKSIRSLPHNSGNETYSIY
jgi:hypothetical protein